MPMKNKALHFLCDSRHFLKDLKKDYNVFSSDEILYDSLSGVRLGTSSLMYSDEYFYEYLLFDDEKDPYQMNNLPLEENKEIVAELCREMGKELKAIDDPWYKERILSDMIPY